MSWPTTALLGASLLMAPARAGSLSGSASYRETIALPPDAVFEVVIEDVSRADAPARVLGRTRIEPAGQPPFRFRVNVDDQALRPPGRYAVRASVRQGDRLLFTTDTITPVPPGSRPTPVMLLLVPVRSGGADPLTPSPRPPRPTPQPGGGALAPQALQGMFRYHADAASIRLCGGGASMPVAMEGDYLRLERAYVRALPRGSAGRPLLVQLDGRISQRPSAEPGLGPVPTLVVDRFVALRPGERCPQSDRDGGTKP